MKNYSWLILNILVLNVIFAVSVFAQGGGPVPDPSASGAVPIDGGISFLAAAGIAYGAKKLYDKRNTQQ